jgi:hypothetical protein
VDHFVEALGVDQSFLLAGANGNDVDATLRKGEILLILTEEATDLGLPELKALMLLESGSLL